MSLDQDTILRIAQLSKLEVLAEEIPRYQKDLDNILHLVAEMEQCPTEDTEIMTHPNDMQLRLREDIVTETDARAMLNKLAPDMQNDLYLVPPVLD